MPDSVFWPVWVASWALTIWSVVQFWAAFGKRRKLMQGKPWRLGRFLLRFGLGAVLFFTAGMTVSIAEWLLWAYVFGLGPPFPFQTEHSFYHLHLAGWLFLFAYLHRLTRGWFSGPAATPSAEIAGTSRAATPAAPPPPPPPRAAPRRWPVGATWLCVTAAFLLGAAVVRTWHVLPPGDSSESISEAAASGQAISVRGNSAEQDWDLLMLANALQDYDVRLDGLRGKNIIAGPVVNGYLVNLTDRPLRISVYMETPLYLDSSGTGSDMIATRIYQHDMRYHTDRISRWVPLFPGERVSVDLQAYSVNHEKAPPTEHETLTVSQFPPGLQPVATQISWYEGVDRDVLLTRAAQMALWKAQGVSLANLERRFHFTEADVVRMNEILAETFELE